MGSNNVQAALQMADNAARQVTSSYREWTAFLATAGRFYKYPFPEQLMIYTQRPEATACAEWDFWNQRMRRYIRRGSRGIALIDNSRGKPTLRYVFDVADTDLKDEKGRNPKDDDRLDGRIALPDLTGQRHTIRAGGVQLNVQKEQVNSPVVCEAVTGGGVLHDLTGAVLRPDQGRKIGAGGGFIITN